MLSKTALNQILSAEKSRLAGRNIVETFIRKNYEVAKLQVSERMRKENAQKAAKEVATILLGKIPYIGSAVSTVFEKVVHNKTSGEILDEALTFYNIADIYAKDICGEVNEGTLKIYVKAQLYLELADALMEYVEMKQASFVSGVRLQFLAKDAVVQRELRRVLTSKGDIELDTFA
ncbi:hypothetical protein [Vibrio neptunius]|uniref:hypothetical protein n=1 Tax=Vibrio neptunius TaxID=170651 RepID=UPI0019D18FBD|nr:hypothetical protein [Vibrio neptunius]MBN3572258.1 hypothetical protein [Vibrio neptunius]QXX08547.1 hypothetical protein KW548_23360 [Vibrio neptunius]